MYFDCTIFHCGCDLTSQQTPHISPWRASYGASQWILGRNMTTRYRECTYFDATSFHIHSVDGIDRDAAQPGREDEPTHPSSPLWVHVVTVGHGLVHDDVETHDRLKYIIMTSSNGNIFRVTGPLSAQRPVTRSFDVFFDLRLNKRLIKQWWGWWFETPSRPLWRHYNDVEPLYDIIIYAKIITKDTPWLTGELWGALCEFKSDISLLLSL